MRSWLQRYFKFRRERIPPSPELRCMPLPPGIQGECNAAGRTWPRARCERPLVGGDGIGLLGRPVAVLVPVKVRVPVLVPVPVPVKVRVEVELMEPVPVMVRTLVPVPVSVFSVPAPASDAPPTAAVPPLDGAPPLGAPSVATSPPQPPSITAGTTASGHPRGRPIRMGLL